MNIPMTMEEARALVRAAKMYGETHPTPSTPHARRECDQAWAVAKRIQAQVDLETSQTLPAMQVDVVTEEEVEQAPACTCSYEGSDLDCPVGFEVGLHLPGATLPRCRERFGSRCVLFEGHGGGHKFQLASAYGKSGPTT